MTVTRINFIEREPFQVTYRKMVIGAVVVVTLFVLVTGLEWARASLVGWKANRLTEEINTLRIERQKILEQASQKNEGGLAALRADLKEPFTKIPHWSGVLKSLGERMPRTLWLASLKSYDKPESPSGKAIILIGEAGSAGEVSTFLKDLADNRYFSNVVLSASQEEKGPLGAVRYHFTIDSYVAPGRRL